MTLRLESILASQAYAHPYQNPCSPRIYGMQSPIPACQHLGARPLHTLVTFDPTPALRSTGSEEIEHELTIKTQLCQQCSKRLLALLIEMSETLA